MELNEMIIHKVIELGGFVFLSIFLYYFLKETFFKNKKIKNQLFFASLLGSSPGCGGAISVATLFTTGALTSGALIAAMIATMGDGSFILISKKPKEFLLLTSIMIVVSLIVGYLVDKFNLLKSTLYKRIEKQPSKVKYHQKHAFVKFNNHAYKLFFILMPIISIICIIHTTHAFSEEALHNPIIEVIVYVTLALIFINTIIVNRLKTCKNSCTIACYSDGKLKFIMRKTFEKTSSIVTLIFISLLLIEIMLIVFKVDFNILRKINPYLAILLAALFGLIPGSAPQIIVTTLFIQGGIPFVVLLANGLATTGDAGLILFKDHRRSYMEAMLFNFLVAVVVATIWKILF